jgi:DNA-binding response OmpR family regulator
MNVLVVEDDLIIADLLCAHLEHDGYHISGVARTLAEAKIAATNVHNDFAVIDLHLADGEFGTAVADHLRKVDGTIRIVFSTGNDDQGTLAKYGDAVMTKPYRMRDIGCVLKIVADMAKFGKTTRALPRNFRML